MGRLDKFIEIIEGDTLLINSQEAAVFDRDNPQPFDMRAYMGTYSDTHLEETEPYASYIGELNPNGLSIIGHIVSRTSIGVARNTLSTWKDVQILANQLAHKPGLDEVDVNNKVVIGAKAKSLLKSELPIYLGYMSFRSLVHEAKMVLSKGAEMSGSEICFRKGGLLCEEKPSNSRYRYEYTSTKFGSKRDKFDRVLACYFNGSQGAKTGLRGLSFGPKIMKEIANVRGLKESIIAISLATFLDFNSVAQFRKYADQIRKWTGGSSARFEIATILFEADIESAMDVTAYNRVLDGRGVGTGSALEVLEEYNNDPTLPIWGGARNYLNAMGAKFVTIIKTYGIPTGDDIAKAIIKGANNIAVSNAAILTIRCLSMRVCKSYHHPVDRAIQKKHLRKWLIIESSARNLHNLREATIDLIKGFASSYGQYDVNRFNQNTLSTFNYNKHCWTVIPFSRLN